MDENDAAQARQLREWAVGWAARAEDSEGAAEVDFLMRRTARLIDKIGMARPKVADAA